MIRLENLKFQYPTGNFKLSIPQLNVEQGEKIAIIGPSGSGKSTLLNIISGILRPKSGLVSVNNTKLGSMNDAQRRNFRIRHIGFIFQDFQLLDYLNVQDNIVHPYRINKALKLTSDINTKASDLAAVMGVADKLIRPISKLSQGEQQRVAICRAMITSPQLILADEATGNLDPANKLNILKHLFHTVDANKSTLLAVTHDIELTSHFDRVIDFKTWIS